MARKKKPVSSQQRPKNTEAIGKKNIKIKRRKKKTTLGYVIIIISFMLKSCPSSKYTRDATDPGPLPDSASTARWVHEKKGHWFHASCYICRLGTKQTENCPCSLGVQLPRGTDHCPESPAKRVIPLVATLLVAQVETQLYLKDCAHFSCTGFMVES